MMEKKKKKKQKQEKQVFKFSFPKGHKHVGGKTKVSTLKPSSTKELQYGNTFCKIIFPWFEPAQD